MCALNDLIPGGETCFFFFFLKNQLTMFFLSPKPFREFDSFDFVDYFDEILV